MKRLLLCIFLMTNLALFADVIFTRHAIGEGFNEPWSITPVDMDHDGDLDVVSAARLENGLAWWENSGNSEFIMHEISIQSFQAMGATVLDVDDDGDYDAVCATQVNGLELWVNDGEQVFTRQLIDNWACPTYVDTADVNQDGITDILVTCCEDYSNRMGWVENLGGLNFISHELMTDWDHANSIDSGDIDSDGDIDIIGTASGRDVGHGEIIIFYNDGSEFFTADTLLATANRPSFAIIRDFDLDGDMDVVATICLSNEAVWFENIDNQFSEPQIIGYGMDRGLTIDVADFDNDGDLDVLAGSINLDRIVWFENNDMAFSEHIITMVYNGAADLYPIDFDQDGDIDILSTAHYADKIDWWENQLYTDAEDNHMQETNKTSLLLNYPNPFNPTTQIEFEIKEGDTARLTIMNLKGQIVKSFPELAAGKQVLSWEGIDNSGKIVASGVYYSVLKCSTGTTTHKMLLLK